MVQARSYSINTLVGVFTPALKQSLRVHWARVNNPSAMFEVIDRREENQRKRFNAVIKELRKRDGYGRSWSELFRLLRSLLKL